MAEKKVIEIEIQDNSKTLKQQYKEAVLEVQKLADAFGATSVEVQNASKRAAELKDQIEDVNDAIQSQKGEGAFIALGKSVSAVANGFSAVQGAMGLVGVESEEVQQAMLRVQSAMALAQGLEGLEDAGRAFTQLKTIVTSFGTTAVNAFKAMSTANKAFIATGIGLLIAGLGTVIAYWGDISKAIGLTSDEQEKYAQKQKIINEQSKQNKDALVAESGQFSIMIERLRNTNNGSKERRDLIKQINEQYHTTLSNIKDEKKFQDSLNLSQETYLEQLRNKYKLQANEEKLQKVYKTISDLEEKRNDARSKADKNSKDFDAYNQRFYQDEVIRIQKLIDKNQEYFEQLSKIDQSIVASNVGLPPVDENVVKVVKDTNEQLYTVNDEYLKRRESQLEMDAENLKEYLSVGIDAQKGFEETFKDVKKTSAKDGIAQLVATRTTELEVEKNTADKKLAIEKSLQEHKAELRQKDFDLALQGIGVIKSIFERSKGVQRAAVIAESAIGIAKIITSTQAANAAAIAKYSLIPGGQAFSAAEIARNKIGAGIGIAANLTATAKALQALGGGSAPSKGGDLSGGGGGVIAPNLNVVGDTGINQLATLQQQPVKAYVVSNDITSAQQFDLKVQQTASL